MILAQDRLMVLSCDHSNTGIQPKPLSSNSTCPLEGSTGETEMFLHVFRMRPAKLDVFKNNNNE